MSYNFGYGLYISIHASKPKTWHAIPQHFRQDVLGGEMLALGQQVRFHVYEDRPGEPNPFRPEHVLLVAGCFVVVLIVY